MPLHQGIALFAAAKGLDPAKLAGASQQQGCSATELLAQASAEAESKAAAVCGVKRAGKRKERDNCV